MLVDLLLIAVFSLALAAGDGKMRSALVRNAALLPGVLKAGLSAARKTALWPLVVLAMLFAIAQWSQGVFRLGPRLMLEMAVVGNVEEREQCFARQRALRDTSAAATVELRCPMGGGQYLTDAPGLRCDAHGQAP